MLFESIEIINKLFTGNVVKHKGEYFTLESAKLYTRPEQPVPIYVATAGPINAKKTGKFADGIITVGAADEKIGMLWAKYEEGAREAGKDPSRLAEAPPDPHLVGTDRSGGRRPGRSRMAERRDALPQAGHQEPRGLRRDGQARRPGRLQEPRPHDSPISAAHAAHIQHYLDMGFDEVHLHNVGRNQAEFIEVFGKDVLPRLKLG